MMLRNALRQVSRNPGFAAVAVLTLALGVGASAAIFTVANGVLLKPLSYPGADSVMRLFHVNDEGSATRLSDPDFADLRERSESFAALAQSMTHTASVAGGTQPSRTVRTRVTGDFFQAIGVAPDSGRSFVDAELERDGPPAVIVSARYRQRYLDPDIEALGHVLRIDDIDHVVVGVMPRGFDHPSGSDLWTPLVPVGTSRTAHNFDTIGRLADGITIGQAAAELDAIARNLRAEHGDDSTLAGVRVASLHETLVQGLRPLLHLLLGASVILFLIAWANVASLLLARAAARRRELAVRVAVGAGRRQLVGQFLAEAALLALVGGALGLALAAVLVEGFIVLQPPGLPRMDAVGIDAAVVVFVLALSALAAAGLGLVGARRALRDGAAFATRQREAGGRAGRGAAGTLVAVQVALALVLVVGAGLLGRSFASVMQVDPGFDPDSTLVMRLALPWPQSAAERDRQAAFHDTLLAGIRGLPGVAGAGSINILPVSDGRWNGTFLKLARPDEVTDIDSFVAVSRMAGRAALADYRHVSDGYFEAMRIPLVQGRVFDGRDEPGAAHAAVISESLAREQWPGEDPLGQLLQFGNMDGVLEPLTIVGIVGDVHDAGLEADPNPVIYADHGQRRRGGAVAYVVRTHGEPLAIVPQIRAALAELDPELPPAFTTLDEVLAGSLAQRRFALALVTAFGVAALMLALVGLYGAVAFSVSQRTREIGVRMAVGARVERVVGMVVGEGMRVVAVGVAVGLVAALALARAAESLVFGVSSMDPVTYVAAPLVLLAAAAVAAWLPARRAARVDPNVTLRYE